MKIDPSRLVWMKNVNRGDVRYAYFHAEEEEPPVSSPPDHLEFKLHWPLHNGGKNASTPKVGDLLLVWQKSRITHLVEFLDDVLIDDKDRWPNHPWRRRVRALWYADPAHEAPYFEDLTGVRYHPQSGLALRLRRLTPLARTWGDKGGLPAFQDHVVGCLLGEDAELRTTEEGAVEAVRTRPASRGQGFSRDAEFNKVIELHAMAAARRHFEGLRWKVEDTSATMPYDLRCTKGRHRPLFVEVKGTTGDGSHVNLTKNEVQHARLHPGHCALFVLHGIKVTWDDEGLPHAADGDAHIIHPWHPVQEALQALTYRYRLPG